MQEKRPILLQGAMEIEISYFKDVLSNIEEVDLYGYKFFKGIYEEYPVIISKTNVGILESGIATFIGITNFNPRAIVNQGTAGACSIELDNYDIIIGDKCININSYITKERKEKKGSSPLEWSLLTFKDGKDELIKVEADRWLYDIAMECRESYKKGKIFTGIIGSGDVWDKEADRIKWFNEKYDVLCEDMETISAYMVCDKLNVPIIGIRVISDNEILNKIFDPGVAIEGQKYAMEIVKKLITKLKENK